ncbi:S49 family peptidase [Bradyrhizobium valentinum]|uniref:Peptidase S49 domain-containing protein n=1 Tax=Bradyrhizobium valentinum TaxID=1518501 RepID=A0A0R3KUT5_9BRAD|nr:S49 family peptidase [Bradyrhizobium valentinum]KRQ99271.1 hypothetical protein CP49_11790 [Bradyrhizobium valentinum]
MTYLSHVADRVFGRPLFIHRYKAAVIASVLGERVGIDPSMFDLSEVPEAFKRTGPRANRLIGEPEGAYDERGRLIAVLYNVVDGVATIPVIGTLINRGAFIGEDSSGFTSYEGLGTQIAAAVADPKVGAILLDIDSPGGEATGMFALAEQVRAARQVKPVTALVNDMAASAAYGIASASTEVVVSPTSITGSIGVVMLHMDQSKEMQNKGRTPTLIYAGAHKVDGNPFGPLTENVRSDLQREVNVFYDRFVETVATGRPSLTADAIRATEASTFIGAEAEANGLADRVGTFAETLSRLSAQVRSNQRRTPMTANNGPAEITAVDQAQIRSEGETAGARAAQARISSILTCEEAKGREPQAQNLALNTSLSVDEAKALLATLPVAPPQQQQQPTRTIEERSGPAFDAGLPETKPDARASWRASLKRVGATLPQ